MCYGSIQLINVGYFIVLELELIGSIRPIYIGCIIEFLIGINWLNYTN